MGKNADAVKSIEEFRAPWETADGTEAEIDKPKLKRYIHNLVTDKAKAQDSRDEALESVTEAEKARDEAKDEAAKASPDEANKKIARLEKENGELKTKVTTLEADKAEADLRSEVLAGLDPKYAKYVTGTTREELEKSLESVKADFGLEDEPKDDENDEDDEPVVRTKPRAKLTNAGDPDLGKDKNGEYDFDKIADGIVGNGLFG